MHYSHLSKVVIDLTSDVHDEGLEFWQGALGLPMEQFAKYPEFHGAHLHHKEFGVLVQELTEGQSRVHLDIHTDDLDAEVARLQALGATVAQEAGHWKIMRDPAGLLFCVIPVPQGTLNDANAARWD